MKNTIQVTIPFYFKGESMTPSTQFDLDSWLLRGETEMPNMVGTVASNNGIGSYSYEVEVMASIDPIFEAPTGEAVKFHNADTNAFDFAGFKAYMDDVNTFAALSGIATRILKEELVRESNLHLALLSAFEQGVDSVDVQEAY